MKPTALSRKETKWSMTSWILRAFFTRSRSHSRSLHRLRNSFRVRNGVRAKDRGSASFVWRDYIEASAQFSSQKPALKTWATLKQFGANPKHLGARMGMIAILHTWGQNMSLHPHLHCIVPGGGVTKSGKWKSAKNKGKYLFNVKSMSSVFRAKYVALLRKSNMPIAQETYNKLFVKNWVIYAKQQFHSPKYVVEYLGRYTHKIAVSNHRIKQIDKAKGEVTFTTKNYKKGGKKEVLKLSTHEFTRRFALHVLPKGFTRIRHYGILSSSWKKEKLPHLQNILSITPLQAVDEKSTALHRKCPSCKKGKLVTVMTFDGRGPPVGWKELLSSDYQLWNILAKCETGRLCVNRTLLYRKWT